MPGIGVPAAAVFLAQTLGKTFDTGAQLTSYAELAPLTGRSGSSIRGEFPARAGNKRLTNALFQSAWGASCHDPLSRAYYEQKLAKGKHHNAAFMCLARRRLNVMYAMIKNRTLDEPPAPETA